MRCKLENCKHWSQQTYSIYYKVLQCVDMEVIKSALCSSTLINNKKKNRSTLCFKNTRLLSYSSP